MAASTFADNGLCAGVRQPLDFRSGMRLALMGLVIGLAGTFATTRVIASMLYGVDAHDPVTIAGVAVVLWAVAGLACFLPAWRMTKVDPMEVLRPQ